MAHPAGSVSLKANDKEYRLHLGMSVLADIQDKHGQDVLSRLEPPEGAPKDWMPELGIVVDILLGALQRHHADEADRWLVDDLIHQNPDGFDKLMEAAFPDSAPGEKTTSKPGNRKRPKRAA